MVKAELDRRQDRRVSFVTDVSYWIGDACFNRRSSDLSAGGIYIQDCSPPEVGTQVKVQYLFMGCPIEADGVVVVSQPPIGFGVSLQDLAITDRELVGLSIAAELEAAD